MKKQHTIHDIDFLKETIDGLTSMIQKSPPEAQRRLNRFVMRFNEEFPRTTSLYMRGTAEAITWALMDGPLALYALGMNGSAIVDLQSIVERLVIRDLVRHVALPSKAMILLGLAEHQTLPDLALTLRDVGMLDDEDVRFARKLTALRNGFAHKNPKRVSNLLCSGKSLSYLDIDSVYRKNVDVVPLITRSIKLLVKMFVFESKSKRDKRQRSTSAEEILHQT